MELFIFRHGETEWTLSGQHTSRTDIGLTEEGSKQAVCLKRKVGELHFDEVYSSPMERSLQTARLAGFHPLIDSDLSEWDYGDFEGLTRAEILKKDPDWNLFEAGAPCGESVHDVTVRADRFLKKISELNKKRIALFSHGHFSRVLAVRWIGLQAKCARFFFLSVGSVSILGFERSQQVIKLWNDTPQFFST